MKDANTPSHPPCSCGWPDKDCEQGVEHVSECELYRFERDVEAYHRRVLGHTLDLLEIDQAADKAMRP